MENLFFCPRADLPLWSVPLPVRADLPLLFSLTVVFWEGQTNFCKKFEPETNFCGRNRYGQAIHPPTTYVSGHFFYILRDFLRSKNLTSCPDQAGRARLPRPIRERSAAPTS